MQPLTWYTRRLQSMPPSEVAWRIRSSLQVMTDRCLVTLRWRPKPLATILENQNGEGRTAPQLADVEAGEWARPGALAPEREWLIAISAKADSIAAHRLSFFNLEDCHLGSPIDWNRDHAAGKAAPMRFAPWIDYRDFAVTGDCKLVWEPNRHHQLVVLGRAYRATGEARYAKAAVEQLDSWLKQCPYGIGMNWRSPLELGIRLINWAWTSDLIQGAGVMDDAFRARLLNAVYLHLWEIARKYSHGSSVNNHLVGEAAGVFIGASYFRNLKNASRQRARAREILCEEIIKQTCPDGCTREQALGYHLFVLQFFLLAALVARRSGDDFPPAYWERLEKMLEFIGLMGEGGRPPLFGDCDDGYVLDLGGERGDARPWLAAGAVLFNRPDFKAWAGEYSETAWWLLGQESHDQFDALPSAARQESLASRAFPESGYYLLQYGGSGKSAPISIVLDAGALGMGPLAAHGHADALAFTLRASGVDVLVDPGTYDYFTYPEWRRYFRSTRAHNTVAIDGLDQSEMLGPFMWGAKANAKCVCWQPGAGGGKVTGEHDGYTRLKDPVIHRRTLELDGPAGMLTVRDEIVARGEHRAEVNFHLAENCRVLQAGPHRFEVDFGAGCAVIELDPRLSVRTIQGSENPIGGWVSRGYHRKAASATLVGICVCQGATSLVCRIRIEPSQAK